MSEDIISKIQKLIAKAESTTHEAEADAFFAKAQELMMRHAIDEEALKAAGKQPTEQIVEVNVTIKDGLPATRMRQAFLGRVARAMNCRVLVFQRVNISKVIGYESDAQFVAMLYMSAELQCHAAVLREMKIAKRRYKELEWVDGVKFRPGVWRRSYIEGYLSRVGDRITERYVQADATHGTGTSIVLRSRGQAAEDWMNGRYTVGQAKKARTKSYDYDAMWKGQASGSSADISGGRGHVGPSSRKELES